MDSNNDLGNMLSKLLEDPNTLASVMSIAGNLMNNLPKDAPEPKEIKDSENNAAAAPTETEMLYQRRLTD